MNEESKDEEIMETPGFAWRVSLSIIVGVGWLVFLILWLSNYPCSILIVGGILGCFMGFMGHKIWS
ncbi:MAG: hypothetical protein ACETVN_04470 [Asgard group archaeon]